MDIFEKYIKENRRSEDCRALTCRSYKKVYQEKYGEQLDDKKTNFELATYGDALLSFALCTVLFDKFKQLSKEKENYESDNFLIEKVAEHYDLLDYMNFDRKDDSIIKDYKDYTPKHDNKTNSKSKNKNTDNPTKYIATTVEAVLGALYRDEKHGFDEICELVEEWTKF